MCRVEAIEKKKKKKMRQPLIRIEIGLTAGTGAVNKVNVADLQFIFLVSILRIGILGRNVNKGRNE